MNWLKALSRAFTVPRSIKTQIAQNPLIQAELPLALDKARQAIATHFAASPIEGLVAVQLLDAALLHAGVTSEKP